MTSGGTVTHHRLAGIDIELVRKPVRNINLRIRPDGTVSVSASPRVPLGTIEDFVSSRETWIRQAQSRVLLQARTHATSCDDGDVIVVWGAQLIIRLTSAGPGSGRRMSGTFSVVGSELRGRLDDRALGDDEKARSVREALLSSWLANQVKEQARLLLPQLEQRVGKRCSQLRFRHMTSRWGSCNVQTAAITLNTELVHHPPHCLEYVMVHELCHLHEPSHNDRFHALMDRFYPGWRTVRAELNGRLPRS